MKGDKMDMVSSTYTDNIHFYALYVFCSNQIQKSHNKEQIYEYKMLFRISQCNMLNGNTKINKLKSYI